jgi:hypothetical protein
VVEVIVITLDKNESDSKMIKEICKRLKVSKKRNIELVCVNREGKLKGRDQTWVDYLAGLT